jgi:hypothetical protein
MRNPIAIAFSAVFGVVPGYGHDNMGASDIAPDACVAHAWRIALEAEFAASGILVGAAVTPGRVVYPATFGCPADGEVIAVVSGNSNPRFVGPDKLDEFRNAVIRVARATKDALGQARLQLTFWDVSGFVYFEPQQEGGEQRW